MKRSLVLPIALLTVQCGHDEVTAPTIPGPEFVSVDAGLEHTCALTESNEIYCWGGGGGGELGDFRAVDSAVPVRVHGITRFTDLSVGAFHACAVDTNGFVHCWGNNFRGQLGNATNINVGTPVPITGTTRFAGVRTGSFHSCAFTSNGTVFCWGAGTQGQLGTTAQQDYTTAQRVITNHALVQLAAGAFHTCGLRTDGAAFCWGANHHGQLGDGTTVSSATPREVAGGLRYRAIAAGNTHTCGINVDGAVYCWGGNAYGALGHSAVELSHAAQPTRVAVAGSFTGVSAGERTTCAVDEGGSAWCWGYGADGQLGDDRAISSSVPRQAARGKIAVGDEFASVSTALTHTCAVTALRGVFCWGTGTKGQLGTGRFTMARSAVPIAWSEI